MRSAYNEEWLSNLHTVKDARQWKNHGFISPEQFASISAAHPCNFFHPNFIIRILIFLASLIAIGGVTGILGLMVEGADPGEGTIAVLCMIYGFASLVVLDFALIRNAKHFKSGVNEALLYHSIGFIIGGIGWIFDFDLHVVLWTSVAVLTFSAIRYIDLLSTLAALGTAGYTIFYEFYELGGVFQQVIPFIFIT